MIGVIYLNRFSSCYMIIKIYSGRDVEQWLECGALSMTLLAVQFRIPLGADFSEKYHVSLLSILEHCFDGVSLGKALNSKMLHLTKKNEYLVGQRWQCV